MGAKVNGKIVPLHYQLRSGDIVEVLTAKQGRGPSRDWLKLVRTSRARNKIRAWFSREGREDAEHKGREQLAQAFKKQGLPYPKLAGSPLLVDVIREMGFRKADDFYIALGQSKISTKVVTNKVMQRLKRGEAVEEEPAEGLIKGTDDARRRTREATDFGIKVKGIEDVVVRLAKCCRPVPGDEIVGYVSLGRGITVHREDCRNVAALKKAPERFTEVYWDGDNESSYRVELQVDAWDRTRLLEDLSRTFAEAGLNILEARCTTKHPMVKNRFVLEVGDTEQLKQCISRLRNVDWRCSTPTGSRPQPEPGNPRRRISRINPSGVEGQGQAEAAGIGRRVGGRRRAVRRGHRLRGVADHRRPDRRHLHGPHVPHRPGRDRAVPVHRQHPQRHGKSEGPRRKGSLPERDHRFRDHRRPGHAVPARR